MPTLSEYITNPETGKPKWGSISRVAEHLGIHRKWVAAYLAGTWEPSMDTHRAIQDFIHARGNIASRSSNAGRPNGRMPVPLRKKADRVERAARLRELASLAVQTAEELEEN